MVCFSKVQKVKSAYVSRKSYSQQSEELVFPIQSQLITGPLDYWILKLVILKFLMLYELFPKA